MNKQSFVNIFITDSFVVYIRPEYRIKNLLGKDVFMYEIIFNVQDKVNFSMREHRLCVCVSGPVGSSIIGTTSAHTFMEKQKCLIIRVTAVNPHLTTLCFYVIHLPSMLNVLVSNIGNCQPTCYADNKICQKKYNITPYYLKLDYLGRELYCCNNSNDKIQILYKQTNNIISLYTISIDIKDDICSIDYVYSIIDAELINKYIKHNNNMPLEPSTNIICKPFSIFYDSTYKYIICLFTYEYIYLDTWRHGIVITSILCSDHTYIKQYILHGVYRDTLCIYTVGVIPDKNIDYYNGIYMHIKVNDTCSLIKMYHINGLNYIYRCSDKPALYSYVSTNIVAVYQTTFINIDTGVCKYYARHERDIDTSIYTINMVSDYLLIVRINYISGYTLFYMAPVFHKCDCTEFEYKRKFHTDTYTMSFENVTFLGIDNSYNVLLTEKLLTNSFNKIIDGQCETVKRVCTNKHPLEYNSFKDINPQQIKKYNLRDLFTQHVKPFVRPLPLMLRTL